MLVTFLERATLSRFGPLYMVGEQADLPEPELTDFLTRGVVEPVAVEVAPDPVPTTTRPPETKQVERAPVDKMLRKDEVKRK